MFPHLKEASEVSELPESKNLETLSEKNTGLREETENWTVSDLGISKNSSNKSRNITKVESFMSSESTQSSVF